MSQGLQPRLVKWWRENDRATLRGPDVQRLVTAIARGSQATDLGGTMSLNVGLQPAGLVLRVHQPFVSRARMVALQEVRRYLAEQGLIVPVARSWRDSMIFRCGDRWAELEAYLPSERLPATPEAYVWMFRGMGALHRALATIELNVPRPVIATYGPPSRLLRWLPRTEAAVREESEASDVARWLRDLVRQLCSQWVPAVALPVHLVHGDVRLSNVRQTPDGATVYFDFGFLGRRPRIHDLGYALAWIVLRPDGRGTAEAFAWETVSELVKAYEDTAQTRLTAVERRALAPYVAAVPLYLAALAGYTPDPAAHLCDEGRRAFLGIGEWVLAHPGTVTAA